MEKFSKADRELANQVEAGNRAFNNMVKKGIEKPKPPALQKPKNAAKNENPIGTWKTEAGETTHIKIEKEEADPEPIGTWNKG